MPTWKKVIVSGSQAEFAGASGSFSGSFSGNGANLTGVTATAVFPTSQTLPILSTTKIFSNDGAGNTFVTAGQITGSTYAGVTGDITIGASGVAAIGSSKVTSAMITDDTIVNADINSAAGIVYTKLNLGSSTIHSGSFFNGITVVSGSSQISYTGLSNTPAGIVSASVLAAGSGQGSTTLTTNGVSSGDITATGLGTAGTPTFAGATLTGNLAINNTTSTALTTTGTTAAVFNANATTINAFGAATTVNLGAATGTTTVNNNLSVIGTLYVQGPVTAISSSNLYIADQFILLASGSATAGDGGIVVDRGSDTAGNIAFGYDSITDRWGFQDGLVDTTNTIDPTSASGVSGSFAVYSFTEAAHGATKPITGEFAVVGSQYLDNAGNFWIYTA